jgi:hydrogenase maturation factor
MTLPQGKIPKEVLERIILKNLGANRSEVVLGPAAGIDFAVVKAGDNSLIISMDPITGALENLGWLAVHVNANDVATSGVEPAFFLSCIMLAEGSDTRIVERISSGMSRAAKALGMAIVGGHCEATPCLSNPIIVGCAFGLTKKNKYVTAAGAKARDKIILTKSAAIEGTAILASEKENQMKKAMDSKLLSNAKQFYENISIVKEAVAAFKTGAVHAMHDPTEGGIAGGIHEIADASQLGFQVYKKRIPIRIETAKVCRFFNIDPLQLIASGSLLIAVKPDCEDRVLDALKKEEIQAQTIGEFCKDRYTRSIVRENGSIENLVRPKSDHLWKALRKD